MTEKLNYLECWTRVATSLLSQALAGEPSLSESLPKPMPPGSFGFAVTLQGDEAGRFSVMLDAGLLQAALLGEGVDQKAGWADVLKEVADAAAGELLAKTGRKVQVTAFAAIDTEAKLTRAFQLKAGSRVWQIQVHSEVNLTQAATAGTSHSGKSAKSAKSAKTETASGRVTSAIPGAPEHPDGSSPSRVSHDDGDLQGAGLSSGLSPGLELLLDVELEASLRFGSREMPLGEILDLGPGDVIQLDRHINDPVDLIVGDKIVARGEVVLVNGNFGLRVTEVAEPQRRLESIRCLF
jgi:flagellar motor switch protein FliN